MGLLPRSHHIRRLVIVVVIFQLLLLTACETYNKAPVEDRSALVKKPVKVKPKQAIDVHWVKRGDTLIEISLNYGLDYRDIAKWNGLHAPYTIYLGQKLYLKPGQTITKKPVRRKPRKNVTTKPAKKPANIQAKPIETQTTPRVVRGSGKQQWIWPVKGRVVSPFKAGSVTSKGITIAGRIGQKIIAAEGGKVVYSGNGLIGYGNLVIIKHNKDYLSAYGYNKRIVVKEGELVKKGQHIADMGKATNGKAGLHFEIRRKGKPIDPIKQLP